MFRIVRGTIRPIIVSKYGWRADPSRRGFDKISLSSGERMVVESRMER